MPPAPILQQPSPPTNTPQLPVVKLGDDDDCMLAYGAHNSVDAFPFGVFYRLVEPRASIVTQALTFNFGSALGLVANFLTDSTAAGPLTPTALPPPGTPVAASPAPPRPARGPERRSSGHAHGPGRKASGAISTTAPARAARGPWQRTVTRPGASGIRS